MNLWEQTGAVKYIGETSNVQPYMEQAHCIVLPSYREGISRVLLEAASMERPIIASNVPGCREIVMDGVNGFLCEVQNTSSLIACMMHMLALPEEARNVFGKNGRDLVHRLYDEKIIIQLYKEKLVEFLPDEC
jgi:glycosyltransferase involved in cell wall biosynthesis